MDRSCTSAEEVGFLQIEILSYMLGTLVLAVSDVSWLKVVWISGRQLGVLLEVNLTLHLQN